MKLLTHNLLTSKCLKGVNVGYPLGLNVVDLKVCEVNFDPDFIAKMIPRIDWEVLYNTAESIGQLEDLPKELDLKQAENDQSILKKLHHLLVEVDIINGELVCPETGRVFPINNGIPNMLLNEDEV